MDMNRSVFGNYGQTDIYRRSLQNIYVNTLCKMIEPEEQPSGSAAPVAMMRRMSASIENNDVKALVAAELESIAKNSNAAGETTAPVPITITLSKP